MSHGRRKSAREPAALFHPRHWPTWLAIGVFRALILLPWPIQVRIGRLLGRVVIAALPQRRKIVETNLRLCFPDLDEAATRRLARAHHEAIGIGVFETCFGWWGPEQRLPRSEIHGAEHLVAAAAEGKGVILLTAHFTTLEMCGRVLAGRFKFGALFRHPDNPVVAHHMRRARDQAMGSIIPMADLRGLIRALKQGETIWYAPDQGKRTKFSSILPFFGVPALTNTATSRIAAMTGSAVVPYFCERDRDGVYHLRIQPALKDFPTHDSEADALRITALIEEAIRLAPEQYFWVHRRFKRRGKNLPNVYRSESTRRPAAGP